MAILVVGSIALDSVSTPHGEVRDAIGGSALYFAASASFFGHVRVVGVVGDDFPMNELDFLQRKGVDLRGLHVEQGKTFRWTAKYHPDMNQRDTLETQLNVFASFRPEIPDEFKESSYVFLANIDPDLQLNVLSQVRKPKVVVCDTMNLWIGTKRSSVLEVFKRSDIVILNDSEAKELTHQMNLVNAAKAVGKMGPSTVVVKKGEHGAMMLSGGSFFFAPPFPTESVFDPTGAGDSFAGGFVGHLAKVKDTSNSSLRRSVVYGSVMASFTVEGFSFGRLREISEEDIEARFAQFKEMTFFGTDSEKID